MPLSVSAKITQPGWHRWPAAPDSRAYLRELHRHLFHIEAQVPIEDDHGVEFHDLADMLREWWGHPHSQHDRGSCESMAAALASRLEPLHPLSVTVGEDGEAWARWRPEG